VATNQSITASKNSPIPATPEVRMRSAICDALYDLEWGVVRPLAGSIELEHALLDSACPNSYRAEFATRRAARALGSLASIMLKIEEAAR
jgi:hypothetical protein